MLRTVRRGINNLEELDRMEREKAERAVCPPEEATAPAPNFASLNPFFWENFPSPNFGFPFFLKAVMGKFFNSVVILLFSVLTIVLAAAQLPDGTVKGRFGNG
jgi:hypothetical protein